MADEVEELIEFLADPRPEAKKMAAEIVEGLTGTQEGLDKLTAKSKSLIPALLRLFNEDAAIAKHAVTAAVNISQDPEQGQAMVERGVVTMVADIIKESDMPLEIQERGIMLLCNISLLDAGTEKLLQLGKGKMEGLHMARLMHRFAEEPKEGETDHFELVANILVNVTRHPDGRKILVKPGVGLLSLCQKQLGARNAVRRRGVSGCLKNLCFDSANCLDALMAEEFRAPLLEAMLAPIGGAENKEYDDDVRRSLAEGVQLLAETKQGREALWEVDGPEKLRKGYEFEEEPGVMEAMEAAARVFISNGGGRGEGDEDEGEEGEEGDGNTKVTYENGVKVVEREVAGCFFPGGVGIPARHFK